MSLSETAIACARIVERGDPVRLRTVMAAPLGARATLFALYAFNVEVARAPWVTQEAMIAEMRLQWWRDALEEIAGGGPVRRHEVVTPLALVLTPAAAKGLDRAVAARRWDIYRDPFEDDAALAQHIDATAGELSWQAGSLLGAAEETVVRGAAFAGGEANWLRAVPELEALGRMPLVDGRPGAVQALAQQALERLRVARADRRKVSREAAQALNWMWQAEAVLSQAAADPRRVADGTLGQSEFRRRAGLIRQTLTGRW